MGPEWDLSTPADLSEAVRQALADTAAHGSLLLTLDPTLENLTHQQGTNRDIAQPEPGQRWPVALIEPVNYRALQLDDLVYLLTMAIASKLGLAPPQPGTTPPTAVNWTLRDGPRCELLDPTGTVLAEFRHAPNRQWQAAARTRGKVLVLYGGELGVRTPASVAAAEYDNRARDAELHASLATGTVLAGIVSYAES